ncbi:MAG: hypothetical protein U1E45_24910 [Geminicoccaceae bacterium]
MTFVVGNIYSTDHICNEVGSRNHISYLPTKDNRVVAARLRSDMNPHLPDIILVGNGSNVMKNARLLAAGGYSVPVFEKVADKKWVYRGEYRCKRQSFAKSDIDKYQSLRKDPLTSILFMVPA